MTVLNEERHLLESVQAVLAQDWPGELEMIIALGPSTDGTDEVAAVLVAADDRVQTVKNPGGQTPAGLNAALAKAQYDVVVRVDGHAVLPSDYVSMAVRTLAETGADNVGGMMVATGQDAFERAVAVAMTSAIGVGSAAFHTGGAPGPADTVYLGVFQRSALDRVGGYDRSFARAQDWELNHRIRITGGTVWFNPDLKVEYRPRGSVRSLARQYFHYGKWRRELMRRHVGTVSARYLAPPVAVSAITLGTLAAALGWAVPGLKPLRLGLAIPVGYVVAVSVGAAAVSPGQPKAVRVRVPLVLATMHGAWGAGFFTNAAAKSSGPNCRGVVTELSQATSRLAFRLAWTMAQTRRLHGVGVSV